MKKSLSVKIAAGIAGILIFVLGTVAWVSISLSERQYLQWAEDDAYKGGGGSRRDQGFMTNLQKFYQEEGL